MNFMSDVKNAQESPAVEPVWDKNRLPWDDAGSAGTDGGSGGTRFGGITFGEIACAGWSAYAAVAAVALAIGLVNALSVAQDAAWRGGRYDIGTPLLWEMTSIVTIILVVPVLFITVRRMRRATKWPWRIGLAVAGIVVFSLLHITGMVGLRKFAMLLAGGSYDFHLSATTLLYEFRKDIVTCLLIGSTWWLIESRRELQRSTPVVAGAPAPAQPPGRHMVWLRDGSARIRIEPSDILWISSAGNYVEYCLANSSNRLVRGTLAATEAELGRFNVARVHRTRLANLDRVTSLEMKPSGDFELTFDTGQTVQGSRRYRNAIASLERIGASNG
jgi:hypothetical protein